MHLTTHATAAEWRIICDCQIHARRERTLWRRSARALRFVVSNARRRSMTLLIGVPIAFGAMGIPTEAMNIALPRFSEARERIRLAATGSSSIPSRSESLPIFTTARVRESFLDPARAQQVLTLDIIKEEFFRTQIPYGSIIYREARRNNLSPELVAAVVESESDFRPRLISEKNAQGLMQIVPETGRILGAGDLFNPEANIAAGTRYLRYLFDRFGDQRVALAAYNAGEGNVERFGGVPPFPETLSYLQRVAHRTSQYRQRVRTNFLASRRMQASIIH